MLRFQPWRCSGPPEYHRFQWDFNHWKIKKISCLSKWKSTFQVGRCWKMSTRTATKATVSILIPGLDPKISKIRQAVCIWCFVILLPLGGHKIFVASLIDPFFVDCTIFHQHSSTDSTGKFHDIHSIQRWLLCFYVCCL